MAVETRIKDEIPSIEKVRGDKARKTTQPGNTCPSFLLRYLCEIRQGEPPLLPWGLVGGKEPWPSKNTYPTDLGYSVGCPGRKESSLTTTAERKRNQVAHVPHKKKREKKGACMEIRNVPENCGWAVVQVLGKHVDYQQTRKLGVGTCLCLGKFLNISKGLDIGSWLVYYGNYFLIFKSPNLQALVITPWASVVVQYTCSQVWLQKPRAEAKLTQGLHFISGIQVPVHGAR